MNCVLFDRIAIDNVCRETMLACEHESAWQTLIIFSKHFVSDGTTVPSFGFDLVSFL